MVNFSSFGLNSRIVDLKPSIHSNTDFRKYVYFSSFLITPTFLLLQAPRNLQEIQTEASSSWLLEFIWYSLFYLCEGLVSSLQEVSYSSPSRQSFNTQICQYSVRYENFRKKKKLTRNLQSSLYNWTEILPKIHNTGLRNYVFSGTKISLMLATLILLKVLIIPWAFTDTSHRIPRRAYFMSDTKYRVVRMMHRITHSLAILNLHSTKSG